MSLKLSRIPVNNNDEKFLIIGCIVSDTFIKRVMRFIKPDELKASYCKTIMKWIQDYFTDYKTAPKEALLTIFEGHRDYIEEAEEQAIDKFLAEANEFIKGMPFNEEFYFDRAMLFLKRNSLQALGKAISSACASGNLQEAEELVTKFKAPKGGAIDGTSPLEDDEPWIRAFTEYAQPLFRMSGALGKFINEFLTRDTLISILAPEKRGKTFMLWEFAYLALLNRCNVLFIQAGDLTESQMYRRMGVRLAGKSDIPKYCREHYSPIVDCFFNQNNTCTSKRRTCEIGLTAKAYHTPEEMYKANKDYIPCKACRDDEDYKVSKKFKGTVFYEKIEACEPLEVSEVLKIRNHIKGWCKNNKLKLVCVPSGTMSPEDLDSLIERLYIEDNFVPDLIAVDYADVMRSSDSRLVGREAINNIWLGNRKLSQKYHCCFMIPTQADEEANHRDTLGLENFSDDKRKRAHITAEQTLNQTPYEKKFGLMRLGLLLAREGEVDASATVTLLQDLYRGMPHLDSFMTPYDYKPKAVVKLKEKNKDDEF